MRALWITVAGVVLGAILALFLVDTAPAQEPVFDPGAWGVTIGPKGKVAVMWHGETGAAYLHVFKSQSGQWARMGFLDGGLVNDYPVGPIR